MHGTNVKKNSYMFRTLLIHRQGVIKSLIYWLSYFFI